jgi:hypothetical protein
MKDNTVKDGTKALTKIARGSMPITKAGKPEVIWKHAEFGRELEKAKKIGPKNMSDSQLLSFCRGISGYYHAHFWVDAPIFSGTLAPNQCRQAGNKQEGSMPEDWLHASMGERHRLGSRRRTPHGPRTGEGRKGRKLSFRKYDSSNQRRIRPRNPEAGFRQAGAVAFGPLGPLPHDLRGTSQAF